MSLTRTTVSFGVSRPEWAGHQQSQNLGAIVPNRVNDNNDEISTPYLTAGSSESVDDRLISPPCAYAAGGTILVPHTGCTPSAEREDPT